MKSAVAITALAIALLAARPSCAQQPAVQANFTGVSLVGSGVSNPTQMVFGPDGKLYLSTFTSGVNRYDYSPAGGISNGVTVWSRPAETWRDSSTVRSALPFIKIRRSAR